MLHLNEPRRYIALPLILALFALGVSLIISTSHSGLGLGLVVALCFLILNIMQPQWLFTIVYPLLITVGQIPISFGEANFSLERLLVIVGGVGLVGGVFVTRQIRLKKISGFALGGVLTWLAFYLAAGFLYPSQSGWSILFGYLQKTALAYMAFLSLDDAGKFNRALRAYLFSGVIASIFTVIAYFEYGSLYIIQQASYQSGASLTESLFQGLARAGTGNAMFLWLSLLMFRQAASQKGRIFWLALTSWLGVINLFALRRELLLTVPLGLAFIAWRNMLGKRSITMFLSILIVALAGWFISLSPEWQDRLFVETMAQFSSSADPRTNMLLKFTPAAFLHSPWLGYGPGNYAITQLQFPETLPVAYLQRGGAPAHNAWSAALVEAGLFAFLGLCVFLYALGKPLLQPRSTNSVSLDIIWAFAPLIFLQLLFDLFFGQALSLPVIWFWFGFLLALEQHTRTRTRMVEA